MLATLMLCLWLASHAQAQKPPDRPPVPNLGNLLSKDDGEWLAELDTLRKNPTEARKKLVQAVRSALESERRWRVFHHLAEFGDPEDLPYLVQKLHEVEEAKEKQALMGAIRRLYQPAAKADDLAYAVTGFSFIQKKSPRSVGRNEDKYVIGEKTVEALHRFGIPLEIIDKVKSLRGVKYSDKEDLKERLEKTLGEELWELHGEKLFSQFQPEPPMAELAGLLRVEMRNPRPGPVLVELRFEAWSGAFNPQPEPSYLFIEGEQTGRVDVPVEAVWNQSAPLRVDMRLREVNGGQVPVFQKIYIEG